MKNFYISHFQLKVVIRAIKFCLPTFIKLDNKNLPFIYYIQYLTTLLKILQGLLLQCTILYIDASLRLGILGSVTRMNSLQRQVMRSKLVIKTLKTKTGKRSDFSSDKKKDAIDGKTLNEVAVRHSNVMSTRIACSSTYRQKR